MSAKPNPGSDAARDVGCNCPVLDNGHGRGDGPFWVRMDCPLHGDKPHGESPDARPVPHKETLTVSAVASRIPETRE